MRGLKAASYILVRDPENNSIIIKFPIFRIRLGSDNMMKVRKTDNYEGDHGSPCRRGRTVNGDLVADPHMA